MFELNGQKKNNISQFNFQKTIVYMNSGSQTLCTSRNDLINKSEHFAFLLAKRAWWERDSSDGV